MTRPITTAELLLQQIADSLVEIKGLLQQGPAAQQDPEPGPVEVRGQADKADADTPPAKPVSGKKSSRPSSGRTRPVSGK